MVLDGEDRQLAVPHTLDRAVIQVQVGHLDRGRQAVGIDREAMILGGDFDFLGGHMHDRLIAAAMAEFELIGVSP